MSDSVGTENPLPAGSTVAAYLRVSGRDQAERGRKRKHGLKADVCEATGGEQHRRKTQAQSE